MIRLFFLRRQSGWALRCRKPAYMKIRCTVSKRQKRLVLRWLAFMTALLRHTSGKYRCFQTAILHLFPSFYKKRCFCFWKQRFLWFACINLYGWIILFVKVDRIAKVFIAFWKKYDIIIASGFGTDVISICSCLGIFFI